MEWQPRGGAASVNPRKAGVGVGACIHEGRGRRLKLYCSSTGALRGFSEMETELQIHVYPDAGHAFNADYRPSHRKEAAEDGWKRMLAWLTNHGVG